MLNSFAKKMSVKSILLSLALALPICVFATEDNYSSQLVNESKHAGTDGYTLVKTRVWPETGCVIDSGKQIVNPGETSVLKVSKAKECDQAGIGYSMYKTTDKKNEHLLGYLSHRFRDGKYSMQISIFCEGDKCVFRDLNPEQNRKQTPQ